MTLLAILIAVLIDYFTDLHKRLRRLHWFDHLALALAARLERPHRERGLSIVLAVIVPLLLIVGFLQTLFAHLGWGLLGLLFAVLVLSICLGALDLFAAAGAYQDACEDGDENAAVLQAERITGDPEAEVRTIARSLFWQTEVQLFGVLFWFVILGPMGAVLYRGARRLYELPLTAGSTRDAARRLCGILDWLPIRFLGLAYALAGDFEKGTACLTETGRVEIFWEDHDRALLMAVGEAALAFPAEAVETTGAAMIARVRSLIVRALGIWAAVLALMTLAGWFG